MNRTRGMALTAVPVPQDLAVPRADASEQGRQHADFPSKVETFDCAAENVVQVKLDVY